MNASDYYKRGAELVDLNKFEEAVPFLKKAASLDPSDMEVLQMLTDLLRDSGQWEKADRVTDNAKDYVGNSPEANRAYGLILYYLYRKEESIPYLKKAYELGFTEDEEISYALGIALSDQEQYEDAIGFLKKHLEFVPDCHFVTYVLGECYFWLKRFEKAEELFAQSIELEPNRSYAHLCMAESALARGDIKKAYKYAKKTLEIDPESVTAQVVFQEIQEHTISDALKKRYRINGAQA